ncbi:MAG: GrpB family protein [Acidobacteria bacterium]|nr:MAG: GrpB family protein [Acidobacteriota bacterium]
MPDPVVVVDPDPQWGEAFASLRERLSPALAGLPARIEHVGSTAVPNLAAKPIIDIDVVVPSAAEVPAAIARLESIGYVHQGDLGIPGREAFQSPPELPRHHLYLCAAASREYERHVRFRDFLRRHPAAAQAYSDLKREAARRFRDDRQAYGDAKSAFIEDVLARADREAEGAP